MKPVTEEAVSVAEMVAMLSRPGSQGPCATCGQHKPLPFRFDEMGGYVCNTCVSARMECNNQIAKLAMQKWDDLYLETLALRQHKAEVDLLRAAIHAALPAMQRVLRHADAVVSIARSRASSEMRTAEFRALEEAVANLRKSIEAPYEAQGRQDWVERVQSSRFFDDK